MAQGPPVNSSHINLPPVLKSIDPRELDSLASNRLPHTNECNSGCREPLCMFVTEHILHMKNGCHSGPKCWICGRLRYWINLHAHHCNGRGCNIPACSVVREQMRSRKIQELRDRKMQILKNITQPLEPGDNHFAERDVDLRRFFCEVGEMMHESRQVYTESQDWMRLRMLGSGGYGCCHLIQDIEANFNLVLKEDKNMASNQDEAYFALKFTRHLCNVPHNLIDYYLIQSLLNHRIPKIQLFMEPMDCCLNEHINEHGHLSQEDVKFFSYQIFEGLSFLHGKNYVHRDIKPANLLLDSTRQRLKITDFGFAVECEQFVTFQNIIPGTRHYNPPEIYGERTSGMFTDVWQAAATTLYMSTGRRPNRHLYAEGQRKETTFRRIAEMEMHVLPSWIQGELRHLTINCLHSRYLHRLSADHAKALIRCHREEPLEIATSVPVSIRDPAQQSRTLDIFVSSTRSVKGRVYLCDHSHNPVNQHSSECHCLICGWVSCCYEVKEEETLESVLRRHENQPVLQNLHALVQRRICQCHASERNAFDVISIASQVTPDLTNNQFVNIELNDRIGLYKVIIISET